MQNIIIFVLAVINVILIILLLKQNQTKKEDVDGDNNQLRLTDDGFTPSVEHFVGDITQHQIIEPNEQQQPILERLRELYESGNVDWHESASADDIQNSCNAFFSNGCSLNTTASYYFLVPDGKLFNIVYEENNCLANQRPCKIYKEIIVDGKVTDVRLLQPGVPIENAELHPTGKFIQDLKDELDKPGLDLFELGEPITGPLHKQRIEQNFDLRDNNIYWKTSLFTDGQSDTLLKPSNFPVPILLFIRFIIEKIKGIPYSDVVLAYTPQKSTEYFENLKRDVANPRFKGLPRGKDLMTFIFGDLSSI